MLSRKLTRKIKNACEIMPKESFANYLLELDGEDKISIPRDGWDFARDFALHLLEKMIAAVESGQWWGYELKALQCLDKIPCDEDDVVRINNYGFPEAIESNMDLLRAMGLGEVL